jgi:metallo-beta-lactamase class B
MKSQLMTIGAVLAVVAALGVTDAGAQTNAAAVDAHLNAAKIAAGTDWTGTLARLCITAPFVAAIADNAPGPAPARNTWFIEPAKVFDNLYFVGSRIHNAWALTNDAGIIILDTLYTYNSEEEILGGLKKLGLDANKIKYVIISHAHGDHVGGAKILQDRIPGVRVVMGGPDWDSIGKSVHGYPEGKPKRDIAAQDGQKITVGDNTVTLVLTPGHTPGTVSMLFTVKDNGKPVNIAYSGGTAFNFPSTVPNFDIYIASQRKMAKAAADSNATVLMSNHTEFDAAVPKIKALAARKPGETHPYDVGKDAVQRYFKVSEECAQAQRLKLSAKSN